MSPAVIAGVHARHVFAEPVPLVGSGCARGFGVYSRVQACGGVCIALVLPPLLHACQYRNKIHQRHGSYTTTAASRAPARLPAHAQRVELLIASPWSPAGGLQMGEGWPVGWLSLADGAMR